MTPDAQKHGHRRRPHGQRFTAHGSCREMAWRAMSNLERIKELLRDIEAGERIPPERADGDVARAVAELICEEITLDEIILRGDRLADAILRCISVPKDGAARIDVVLAPDGGVMRALEDWDAIVCRDDDEYAHLRMISGHWPAPEPSGIRSLPGVPTDEFGDPMSDAFSEWNK